MGDWFRLILSKREDTVLKLLQSSSSANKDKKNIMTMTPEENNNYQENKMMEFCVKDLDYIISKLIPVANEEIMERLSRVRNHLKVKTHSKYPSQQQSQQYYPLIDDEEDDFVDLI